MSLSGHQEKDWAAPAHKPESPALPATLQETFLNRDGAGGLFAWNHLGISHSIPRPVKRR